MRVLITRPLDAATRTAARLLACGHTPLIAPVIVIEPCHEPAPAPPPEGAFAAVIASSANAFHDTDTLTHLRHLPLLAVGLRTAEAARAGGFTDIRDAHGDASDLARLAVATLPLGAHLLVLAGRDRTDTLDPALTAAGFSITVWTRYAAKRVKSWSASIETMLKNGEVDAVLHYSVRSARFYLELASQTGLMTQARASLHIAISPAVATILHDAALRFVRVAAHPDEANMLACLEETVP